MEFVWNDGGRSACGFVGLTGDCVTRSIAIATGMNYRDVYAELGKRAEKTPRKGVPVDVAADYLSDHDWTAQLGLAVPFHHQHLPAGVVIVHLGMSEGRAQHFCTVIDHTIHDTWNPTDDDDYLIHALWQRCDSGPDNRLPSVGPRISVSQEQELTQKEFDKIMRRLRALDNTASNNASTEGEKRNALRMMQALMLRHNLSRDDIVDDDNVDLVQFTRMTCPVNGRRACRWEKALAEYVCNEIFPTVQWYMSTKGHRTIFTYYGPRSDVQNSIALFRELLLTIATSAQIRYGGYVRGSGASYAEGYVVGLPRATNQDASREDESVNNGALIHTRTLALHNASRRWLRRECNISLTTSSSSGRHLHDAAAARVGKLHGSKHQVSRPDAPKRIGH